MVSQFDSGLLDLGGADAIHIEFQPAVEFVNAILLLVDVGQLGVAIAEHVDVIEQDGAELLEAVVEFVQVARALAIAPGVLAFFHVRDSTRCRRIR